GEKWGGGDTGAALSRISGAAEFDHRVTAKVAKQPARTAVDTLFVELVVDVVVARGARVDLVAAADDEHAHAIVEIAVGQGRLSDLHRHHHVLQRPRKVADLDPVALDDLGVEIGGELVRAAAAGNRLRLICESGHHWLSLLARRALGEDDRDLLEAEDVVA